MIRLRSFHPTFVFQYNFRAFHINYLLLFPREICFRQTLYIVSYIAYLRVCEVYTRTFRGFFRSFIHFYCFSVTKSVTQIHYKKKRCWVLIVEMKRRNKLSTQRERVTLVSANGGNFISSEKDSIQANLKYKQLHSRRPILKLSAFSAN